MWFLDCRVSYNHHLLDMFSPQNTPSHDVIARSDQGLAKHTCTRSLLIIGREREAYHACNQNTMQCCNTSNLKWFSCSLGPKTLSNWWWGRLYFVFLCYIYLAIEIRNIYTHLLYNKTLYYVQMYSISKKHVNMIEIILERSNQLVIQLNSLASVPTPLGRTCINRRSIQTGHSTLSPGNPVWPELTVFTALVFTSVGVHSMPLPWCHRPTGVHILLDLLPELKTNWAFKGVGRGRGYDRYLNSLIKIKILNFAQQNQNSKIWHPNKI